jgi:copper chaperone CopZ
MRIMGYADHVDLRFVNAKHSYLQKIIHQYNLSPGEAVCFTNKAQTRFRLIMNIRGCGFLAIPEVDEKNKLSIYLKISEELAKMAGIKDVKLELNLVKQTTTKRIRRKKRLKAVKDAKGRKKSKSKRKKAA